MKGRKDVNQQLTVTLTLDKQERLDKALTIVLPQTRSVIQQWLKNGQVAVNGEVVKANYKAKHGDEVTITLEEEAPLEVEPEDIPLEIVYEDDYLLVVNKPSGMVVHPSKGHTSGTLVNALLYRVDKLSQAREAFRPGIVHRIDKDTSGLLVVAKTAAAHLGLSEQLMAHTMERTYVALVEGTFEHETGTVDAPLARDTSNRLKRAVVKDGRRAVTHFTVVESLRDASLVRLQLETGRTHQIRVHMAFIGHPLLNDPMYHPSGKHATAFGQYLHAESIGFVHPITGEQLSFTSPLPAEFTQKIEELRL